MYFDGVPHLLDDGIAGHGLGCEARDGLFPLAVQVATSSRWPFTPACRGKGCYMRRTRGVPEATFSPCPTRKRYKSPFLNKWPSNTVKHYFPPCLSRKRLFECCLRWAFPPACRGKDCIMDLASACDGLFPLSIQEKSISGLPGVPQRGPERSPKVARELPSQKTTIFGLDLL